MFFRIMAKYQSFFFFFEDYLGLTTKGKMVIVQNFSCPFIFCQQGENTALSFLRTLKMKTIATT